MGTHAARSLISFNRNAVRVQPGSSVTPRLSSKGSAFTSLAVVLAAGLTTLPASAADVANGELLFGQKCAACHAGGSTLVAPYGGNDLSMTALEKNGYGTKAELAAFVSKGKGRMPAFGPTAPPYARFSEAQIDDVAEYVLGQAAAGWK